MISREVRQIGALITLGCSMGCAHCSAAAEPDGEDMTLETWRRVVEYCRRNQYAICLSGGEPLEHSDFWHFVDAYVRQVGSLAGLSVMTSGSEKESALALAELARAGYLPVRLSLTDYHKTIDPAVRAAFLDGRTWDESTTLVPVDLSTGDLREVLFYVGLVNEGRARELRTFKRDSFCIADQPCIMPDGTVRQCYCVDAPVLFSVNDTPLPTEPIPPGCYAGKPCCRLCDECELEQDRTDECPALLMNKLLRGEIEPTLEGFLILSKMASGSVLDFAQF